MLVLKHAYRFGKEKKSQAYEKYWISSIYAQLNGAVQHPHSVATSQHLEFPHALLIFFISAVRKKEALKNEMPVALVKTNNKGTNSHHVNKTNKKQKKQHLRKKTNTVEN